ncbi:MAG: beta-lactamase family protein, partial [Chloroflexi bacterium]|nr:beta-lactamase family protein [Chloroflexota bacterium]
AEQLERGWHPGAQLAVYRDGVLALDLAGGHAGPGRSLRARDRMLLFSATKPLLALCIHRLHERGLLPYDAPLARWWPEFARHGKGAVTVRHVLTHAGGFPQLPPTFDWSRVDDWEYVVAETAALPAAWEPGTAIGYHPVTYGWALGELARRIDGREPRQLMHDELFAPLGVAAELSLGLDDARRDARVPVYACSELTRRDPTGCERSTSRITELFNGEAMARAGARGERVRHCARARALLRRAAPRRRAAGRPAAYARHARVHRRPARRDGVRPDPGGAQALCARLVREWLCGRPLRLPRRPRRLWPRRPAVVRRVRRSALRPRRRLPHQRPAGARHRHAAHG